MRFALLLLGILCVSTSGFAATYPFSYANSENGDFTQAVLDLSLNFERKEISGVIEYDLKKSQNPSLVLDTRALEIRKVERRDGTKWIESKDFSLGKNDEELGQALNVPLKPETTAVRIDYVARSKESIGYQWVEAEQTQSKHPFFYTNSESIGARSWVPCPDTPAIRTRYRVTLHVSPGLMAVASGANSGKLSSTGIYKTEVKHPIPTYLWAVAAGKMETRKIGKRSNVYAEAEVVDAAAKEFSGEVDKVLTAARSILGKYDWDRADLLFPPFSYPIGGMEDPEILFLSPSIIVGDKSMVAVIIHELAHSLSGNTINNANWNEEWLTEGFTTYFENRIAEKLYGHDYVDRQRALSRTVLENKLADFARTDETKGFQALQPDLKDHSPGDIFSEVIYQKGDLLLHTIETQVGQKKIDEFMRDYFGPKYRYKPSTAQRFEELLRKHFGDDYVDHTLGLQEWLHGYGIPKNAPIATSKLLAQADGYAKDWMAGQELTAPKSWDAFSSARVLDQLIQSGKKFDRQKIKALDGVFGFSKSSNGEVVSRWLPFAAKNDYRDVADQARTFLGKMGRGKFNQPVYVAFASKEANPFWKSLGMECAKKFGKRYDVYIQKRLTKLYGDPLW